MAEEEEVNPKAFDGLIRENSLMSLGVSTYILLAAWNFPKLFQ